MPDASPLVPQLICLALSLWLAWLGALALDRLPHESRLGTAAGTLLLSLALWWPLWLGLPLPQQGQGWKALGLAALAALACIAAVSMARANTSVKSGHAARLALALLSSLALCMAALLPRLLAEPQAWPASPKDWLWPLLLAFLQSLGLLLLRQRQRYPVLGKLSWPALAALSLPVLLIGPPALAPLSAPAPAAWLQADLLWLLLTVPLALALVLKLALRHGMAARTAADTLRRQQLLDPLTELASRHGVEQQLALQAMQADRSGIPMAAMVFNLDGFRSVNTAFGHELGDTLLRETAERLRRECAKDEFVGRVSADEFALLIPQAGDMEQVGARARRLLQLLSQPFASGGRAISLSCSAGIAFYPEHGAASRLLACAELAAQQAKRLGGSSFSFYDRSMDGDSRAQIELLAELRQAIERDALQLYFQPKIDARSGQITAAEALLRWNHPSRGVISPAVFIPIAERFGLMRDLGNWVIKAACLQARSWREQGLRMRLAINLSAQQMRQADIVERISTALQENRIQPSLLTCEITESVAMEDTHATQETFRALGDLGVHLSIDDFGTGYSSLAYLRQLPAKELKIDRSFVAEIDTNSSALTMVDAILRLAHALNLRVVAEGVERESQQKWLVKLGCDELQGYLYARPMSSEALLMWAHGEQGGTAPEFRASLFGETAPQELGR
ncbi:MAG: putative bifunctional diguanylate cyclase/phosphodiesterase [Roseateles asaccharophilus]|uniref:Diguanylate cyclase (GGDEF)-like protein n=1 Tax=Roseateles asaccharophilus TaxID=582607 RepID=A0A4R6N300_9BURK|nr:bifunctional diguanylate cyclase/phosphodiesterase [Roseateles asaccharophilus]MDN3544733.1 bifunctional diguanylate cyclase/phosphodiesterase [Roseateles asaccharophilus]TDP09500.1 diguanylate cyclase (GGDEF)-like protein [Roseateles asaccharophilus]